VILEIDRSLDLVVAGHIVIDEIIDFQDQITPRRSLGGPPAYSSIALASLGFRSTMVTKIGEDFPFQYSEFLKRNGGINVEKFKTKNERTTSFKIDRTVEPRRMWLISKCANISSADFSLYVSSESGHNHGKSLIVNGVAGEISLSVLDRISKEFHHVFVDSQGFVRRFSVTHEVELRSGLDISALSGVDFLKADRRELSAWTGIDEFESSLRQISRFVSYTIVTSGPGHAEIYEGQRLRWRFKPIEVTIADTTGAGDIFLSIFAASFSETENFEKSLSKSCCAASFAVETKGIEKAILDKQKIEKASERVEVLSYD
jgi:sugar/nucleoside kinase (ribokinase family)